MIISHFIGSFVFLALLTEAIRFGPIEPGERPLYLSPDFFQSDSDVLTRRGTVLPDSRSFSHFGNVSAKETIDVSEKRSSSGKTCDWAANKEFSTTLASLTNDALQGDNLQHVSTDGEEVKCSGTNIMLFNELSLKSVEITFNGKGNTLKSFSLTGRIQMGSFTHQIQTDDFDEDTGLIKFHVKPAGDMQPMKVALDHGIQPGELSPQNAVFAGSKLGPMMFRSPTITGYFNFESHDFQYVLASDAQTHNPFAKFAKVTMKLFINFMTVGGKKPSRPKGAFVFEFPQNKNLLEIVKESLTFKIGLRGLPLLKRIHDRPWCITVAPADISFMGDAVKEEIRRCFPDMDSAKRVIPQGYNIPVSIDLKKALEDCGATAGERKAIPDVAVILGRVTMQAVKFDFPAEYTVPVKAALTCSGAGGLSDLPFNLFNQKGQEPIFQLQEVSWTPSAESIHAQAAVNAVAPKLGKKIKFDYNKNNKMYLRITIVLTLPKSLRKIPGVNVEFGPFKMHFDELLEKGKWKITGLAQLKFSNGISANINLAHKMGTPGWKFILQIPSIKLAQFMKKMNDVDSDSGTGLDDMGIQDFRLEWNIKQGERKPVSVKIRGNPVIAGYSGAHVEAMWWRADDAGKTVKVTHPDTKKVLEVKQPQYGLAFGVFFGNINLDWIIDKVFGFKLSIPWFSNLKAFLTWTNAAALASTKNECTSRRKKRADAPAAAPALKEICFTVPGLAGAPVIPDVNAMLLWDIPRTTDKDRRCAGNKMCEFMVTHLSQVQSIQLSLFFNRANKYFAITAAIRAQIQLSDKLVLQDLVLRIAVSLRTPFSFKIICSLVWNDPSIGSQWKFTGSVELKAQSISLRFTWQSGDSNTDTPPKLPIQFKNILLGGGYAAGVPTIELGMEFWVGTSANHKNRVKVAAYGGYTASQVWFYGRISSLTIDGFCKAFDKDCGFIPKVIKDSGFNKETTVSVAAQEQSIAELGITVPAGFAIIGGINILGVEAWGKILNTPGGIEVDLNMKPINWAFGLIKIRRSKDNGELGPRMNIRFTKEPYTYVWIQGYARVLAYEGEIKIVFQESMCEAILDGPIFFGLNARTELKATYGNLKTLSFRMYVDVHASQFTKDASAFLTQFITDKGQKVQELMTSLNKKLTNARQYVANARNGVEAMKQSITDWQANLRKEYAQLVKKEKEADTDRCYNECPKYCVPYPTWVSPCTAYWVWGFGCIQSACSWTRSPICLTGCLLKDVGNSISTWFTKRKLEIQQWFGDRGKDLLNLASSFMSVGEAWIKMLESVVNKAKIGFKSMENALVKLASGNIFSLSHLRLEAEMTNTFDFCGSFDIKCVLFGYNIEKKAKSCWSATFIRDMILGASENEKELEGLSKTEIEMENVKEEENTTEEAEDEFKRKKGEAEADTKTQMAKEYQKLQKRGKITVQEMDSFAKSLPKEDGFIIDESKKMIYEPVKRFDSREKYHTLKLHDVASNMAEDPSEFLKGVDITPKKQETLEKRTLNFEKDLTPCGRVKKSLTHYEEMTNVLVDNAKSIMTHQTSNEAIKRSDIERLRMLKDEIERIDERFNMTSEDHADAWFLYNQAVKVQQDLERKSKNLLEYHKRSAMPIVRRQLDYAIKQETGKDLEEFFHLVHHHAMAGFKRSNIPNPEQTEGIQSVNRIRKDLSSILFQDKDVQLGEKHGDLVNIRNEIQNAKQASESCRDN